jgi:hypothetical protein
MSVATQSELNLATGRAPTYARGEEPSTTDPGEAVVLPENMTRSGIGFTALLFRGSGLADQIGPRTQNEQFGT